MPKRLGELVLEFATMLVLGIVTVVGIVVYWLVRTIFTPQPPALESKPVPPAAAAVEEPPVVAVVEPREAADAPDPAVPVVATIPQAAAPVREARPRRNYVEFDKVAHFPDLPTKTARCVGMGHYLSDAQRQRLNPGFVIAIPEPTNKHDPNAIVITDPAGRKLGYLSAGQAKSYAPLIQAVGALQLDCRRDGSKLWLDLPNLPALRKYVRTG